MSGSHTSSAPGLSLEQSAVLTRRATSLSVLVAAILIVIKGFAWWQSGSVSMMASLADSSLDLVASLATFFAVRYATAPPDAEHRFGHGKAEAFASLLQGGLVFASAALIGQDAARPSRACVVLAVEDNSGVTGPTGSAADGALSLIAATADNLITETLFPVDADGDGEENPGLRG